MKKKMSIVVKLISMSVLPVLVLGIVLSIYGQKALQSNLKKEVNNGLKSIAIAIDGSYDAAGEGDFIMLESGNIIKGMTAVSGNYDLYDKIKKDSQTDAALYSNGAMSQAEDTTNAMENIEQMGQLIEQMVTDIGSLAEQSENIETTSQSVNSIIQELSAYTQKTTDIIGEISHQTEVTNSSAHEIRAAVEIIQSIAEETNLLSLNASIEAARAGENGKGFAVVAAQIQKLAEQSNQSAQQIEKVIATLLADSEKSVETMHEVVDMVGSQDEKLRETEQGFVDVNAQIQQSKDRIETIRKKSQVIDESRKGIMEVITNLSAISEENASVAEQTASSSENLSRVVETMTQEAKTLKELAQQLETQIDSFVVS